EIRGRPRRRIEADGGGNVVGQLDAPGGIEPAESLGERVGDGLAVVVGQGDAGDPFGLLDHLRGDRRWVRRGGGGDGDGGPVEDGGADAEGTQGGEQFATVDGHGGSW